MTAASPFCYLEPAPSCSCPSACRFLPGRPSSSFDLRRFHGHNSSSPTSPFLDCRRNTRFLRPNHTKTRLPPPLSPILASSDYDSQIPEHVTPENKTRVSTFDALQLKRVNGFLDEGDLTKLRILEKFLYVAKLGDACLQIRLMAVEEMEETVGLLADSFAELTWAPLVYAPMLKMVVKQHVVERRAVIPHAATLVGLYETAEGKMELAGTVELSFDSRGSNAAPPTPTPPRGSPYLCNMSVKKELRRRGIGRHLLKASEELIPQMGASDIYLHCRLIDAPALRMYSKSGYNVVQTDSILSLLSFQRRKHLMYKKLPSNNSGPTDPM